MFESKEWWKTASESDRKAAQTANGAALLILATSAVAVLIIWAIHHVLGWPFSGW
jgi:hypothetical protein